jgi:hypothetical protein
MIIAFVFALVRFLTIDVNRGVSCLYQEKDAAPRVAIFLVFLICNLVAMYYLK